MIQDDFTAQARSTLRKDLTRKIRTLRALSLCGEFVLARLRRARTFVVNSKSYTESVYNQQR